ncbi:MAG: hypothetical protein AABX47_09030 [Nanoarchaeota archaeon]
MNEDCLYQSMPNLSSEEPVRKARSVKEAFHAYKSAENAFEHQGIRGLISSILPVLNDSARETEFASRRADLLTYLRNGVLVAFYRPDNTFIRAVIGRRPGEYGLTCNPSIRMYKIDKATGLISGGFQNISMFADLEIITENASPRTRLIHRY